MESLAVWLSVISEYAGTRYAAITGIFAICISAGAVLIEAREEE